MLRSKRFVNFQLKRLIGSFANEIKSSPTWLTVSDKDLVFSKANIELLLYNKIPAIRIPNFYGQSECENFSKTTLEQGFDYYKDVHPKIGRIGITQFEHSNDEPRVYFSKVAKASQVRDTIFKNSNINPLEHMINLLRYETGLRAGIANDAKFGVYFSGLIRHIKEASLHFDFAQYDAPDYSINNVVNQLAFNIYFQSSEHGGECVVYNQQWQPGLFENDRLSGHSGSYGYSSEVTKGAECFFIKPKTGDLWLFNSRNFHKILYGSGTRLSFSSFIGLTDKNELVLWS